MAYYKKRPRKKKLQTTSSSNELSILPIDPLTTDEESDRLHLERKVERAFYEAGMALMQLRDRKIRKLNSLSVKHFLKTYFFLGNKDSKLL